MQALLPFSCPTAIAPQRACLQARVWRPLQHTSTLGLPLSAPLEESPTSYQLWITMDHKYNQWNLITRRQFVSKCRRQSTRQNSFWQITFLLQFTTFPNQVNGATEGLNLPSSLIGLIIPCSQSVSIHVVQAKMWGCFPLVSLRYVTEVN